MKNFIFLTLFSLLFFGFLACEKYYQTDQPKIDTPNKPVQERIRIYTACWDEWGRKSKNCGGWGLCNFEDCWGWQEPCCGTSAYSGVIAFDYTANEYFLTITLSNTDTLQIAATQSQLPLYVDEDIIEDSIDEEWDFVKIEAGEYPFLSSIGSYGGYKLPVIFY